MLQLIVFHWVVFMTNYAMSLFDKRGRGEQLRWTLFVVGNVNVHVCYGTALCTRSFRKDTTRTSCREVSHEKKQLSRPLVSVLGLSFIEQQPGLR